MLKYYTLPAFRDAKTLAIWGMPDKMGVDIV
jgi:hypothetical protein